ncbi:MAG: hypothetical protein BM558_09695 [Roseobacter sp. MedPE-SW]|nr:MAG: hypothetical protein BM558_09695 [Roseobacter sp. MedPE-SW]
MRALRTHTSSPNVLLKELIDLSIQLYLASFGRLKNNNQKKRNMKDQDDFVKALKSVLCEGASRKILDSVSSPVGRGVTPEMRDLASWARNLSGEDLNNVLCLIEKGIDQTVFGFLCVLDGVRAIEPMGEKGSLQLRYLGPEGTKVNLTREEGEFLHDAYKGLGE